MKLDFRPRGICSSNIHVELEDGLIKEVVFTGGCDGNHRGIASLVRGMQAREAITRLQGIKCGGRSTSCPDQLAQALKNALSE